MREFNTWTWIIKPCDSHHSVFTSSFQDVGQGQLLFYCQPRTELITEETHVSTASVMKFSFYSVLFSCFLLENHYAKENIFLIHQHKDDKTLRIFILSRCHWNFYKCDQKLFLPAQGNPFFGKIFSAKSFAYMRNTVQKCFFKAPRRCSCQCQPLWGIWEGNGQTCQCLC